MAGRPGRAMRSVGSLCKILEIPIATPGDPTRRIYRRSHIGASRQRYIVDQPLTEFCCSHIATVNQNVAIFAKRHAPSGEFIHMFAHIVSGHPGTAKLNESVGAVSDKMDRRNVGVVRQSGPNLVKSVSVLIQYDDINDAIVSVVAE